MHTRALVLALSPAPSTAAHLPRFRPLQRLANHEEPPTSDNVPHCRLRYALRVSHPLDVLLPSWSAGPISSRSRSWGSPFEALHPQTVSQTLSGPAAFLTLARPTEVVAASPSRLVSPSEGPPRGSTFDESLLRMPPWACASLRYIARCDVPTKVGPFPLVLLQRAHR
jgi:hypothetical protein